MVIHNEYVDLIDRLCHEVIPGYKPPVQVRIEGRYALGQSATPAMQKSISLPILRVNIEVKL